MSAESLGVVNAVASNRVLRTLERLYEEALGADRQVEARYYLRNIQFLYPGWKYQPETTKQIKETK